MSAATPPLASAPECTASAVAGVTAAAGCAGATAEDGAGDFDFSAEVQRQVDAASGEASRESQTKKAESGRKKPRGARQGVDTPKLDVNAERICKCCPEPVAAGAVYCWPHKRAKDNIYKAAMKGKNKKTQLYLDCLAIFGQGREAPPDEEVANQVLIDYVIEFPEDETEKPQRGSRKPRGQLDLNRYVHRRGSKTSQESVTRYAKLDFELFSNKMKAARGWSLQRSKEEWQRLEGNAAIPRDELGIGPSKLRLAIPPALLGEDFEEHRAGSFQERSLETGTKSMSMSGDEKSAWLAATSTGFDAPGAPDDKFKSRLFTPMSSQSCASEADELAYTRKILGKAATEVKFKGDVVDLTSGGASDAGVTASPAAGGTAAGKRAMELGQSQESPPKAAKTVDVQLLRNELWGKVRDQAHTAKAKLLSEIKAACVARAASDPSVHGKIFIDAVQDRVRIACAVLGLEAKIVRHSEGAGGVDILFEPRKFEDGKNGMDEASAAGAPGVAAAAGAAQDAEPAPKGDEEEERVLQHDLVLEALLGDITILPMESAEIMSWSRVELFHKGITKIVSEEALEQAVRKWEVQVHLLSQLTSSTKQSTKELNSEIKTVSTRQKKEQSKKEKERLEAEAGAKKSGNELARRILRREKESAAFGLDFAAHPKVVVYNKEAGFKAAVAGASVQYGRPWILRKADMAEKIFEGEDSESTLKATGLNWQKAFAKQAVYKENDVVSSPLTAKMGALDLAPLMELCVPTSDRIRTVAPTISSQLDATKITAESEVYFNYDFEQVFLGSIRVQLSGITKVIAVRPEECVKLLSEESETKDGLQLAALRQKLLTLTQADLKTFKEKGVEVYTGEIGPCDVLYVPPGWLFGTTTANGVPATSLKRWFLPSMSLTQTQATILSINSLGMRPPVRETLAILTELIAAKVVVAPAKSAEGGVTIAGGQLA